MQCRKLVVEYPALSPVLWNNSLHEVFSALGREAGVGALPFHMFLFKYWQLLQAHSLHYVEFVLFVNYNDPG